MDTKYTDLLERYFSHSLSSNEIKEVEELLRNNEEFKLEYELFEKAIQVAKLHTISGLKQDIREIRESANIPKTRLISPWLKIAASVILLAVIGTGFYAQTYSNDSLYVQAYVPVSDYITNLDNDLSSLEKAVSLYNTEEYQGASEIFKTIASLENSESHIASFYLGICYMQMDKMDEAVEVLQRVQGPFKSEAQWYLALAHLKLDHDDVSIVTLKSIVADNSDEAYVIKAQTLLNHLNNPLRNLVLSH